MDLVTVYEIYYIIYFSFHCTGYIMDSFLNILLQGHHL